MEKNNKLLILGFIVFIIFICFVSCGNSNNKNIETNNNEQIEELLYLGIEEYEVGCFETLSDIAVKYIPSDEYMSDWIADVKRLNGRKTNDIYFGEVIKVYYY